MKNIQALLGLIIAAIIFSACSKKDNTAPAPTKTAILTGHSWKITGLMINGEDKFADYDDCTKDDILHFNINGTLLSDNGTVHCNPGEAAVTSIFWNLSPDETSLTTSTIADGPGITYVIVSLTSQTLDLRISADNNSYDQIFTAQ
jgi:hypothetical protein